MTAHHSANLCESGNDDMEQLALEECIKRQRVEPVTALIMPAARCQLPQRLAAIGATVIAADEPALQQDIEGRILAAGHKDAIRFLPYTLPTLPAAPERGYDIIVLRRGLCHLPHEEARQVVRGLLKQLRIGGKLFVSILGLHSELGDDYAHGDRTIGERFCELAPEMVEKYGIHGPVCLYTERDLFLLLLTAGGSVLRTLTTSYGNVKGVAMRV